MRFFVTINERSVSDPQEEAAMLGWRIESIKYQRKLLTEGVLSYAFKSDTGDIGYLLAEAESLEKLDRYLKADPLFSYAEMNILPVISSQEMVRELQDYLGERLLSEQELKALESKPFTIDPKGSYMMVQKAIPAFSPLLSLDQQRDIHRRTVLSQRLHDSPIELLDVNPVGKPWGILILKTASLEEAQRHVSAAPVYPDTKVGYQRLKTLEQCMQECVERLQVMGRSVRSSSAHA